jgi:hypothetical protein
VADEFTRALVAGGWRVVVAPAPQRLPGSLSARYPWMPAEWAAWAAGATSATAADEKTWLLTAADFAGTADSAFAWNEWERLSLDAACDDRDEQRRIRQFWDAHLPVLTSVRSGYAFAALERGSLRVVVGREPEFEAVSPICASFADLIARIAVADLDDL